MTIHLTFHHHPYFDTHGDTTLTGDRIVVKVDEKLVEEDDGYGNKIPKTFSSVSEVYKWLLANVGVNIVETHKYG